MPAPISIWGQPLGLGCLDAHRDNVAYSWADPRKFPDFKSGHQTALPAFGVSGGDGEGWSRTSLTAAAIRPSGAGHDWS